jgi:hypothetical protein
MSGFSTAIGQLPATITNDNAAAGKVGEYIESILTSGSPVSLTTNAAKTVTSISLTAGDWDVDCVGALLPAATTSITDLIVSLSLVTNTFDATTGRIVQLGMAAFVPGATQQTLVIPPYRFSLSATTTIFLIAQSTFTVSTMGAFGIIRARRVR